MKEHFSPRSILFYGCAIASVVTLFSMTTSYGEKHLQAPRRIDGRYRLSMSAPSECFAAKPVTLLLQQSGVFLTGSLVSNDALKQTARVAQKRPLLAGEWRSDQLWLEGRTGREWNCQNSVKIEGRLTGETLDGTLRLGGVSDAIAISAQREAPQPKSADH